MNSTDQSADSNMAPQQQPLDEPITALTLTPEVVAPAAAAAADDPGSVPLTAQSATSSAEHEEDQDQKSSPAMPGPKYGSPVCTTANKGSPDNGPPFSADYHRTMMDRAFRSFFSEPSEMVWIETPCGLEATPALISEVIKKSPYFRAALTGDFEGAGNNRVIIEEAGNKRVFIEVDVSDDTVDDFLTWVYSDALRTEYKHDYCKRHKEVQLDWSRLVKLWCFAGYLQTPELQSEVVDSLVQKMVNLKGRRRYQKPESDFHLEQVADAVKLLWSPLEGTPEDEGAEPLCDLMLDFIGNPLYMSEEDSKWLIKGAPGAFACEFATRTIERAFNPTAEPGRVALELTPPPSWFNCTCSSVRYEWKPLELDDSSDEAESVQDETDVLEEEVLAETSSVKNDAEGKKN